MWIFGYGSLMWDGWEEAFGGRRVERAVLAGYRRAFNKKSVTNWGTREAPCPTLGLEQDDGAACVGVAFSFPETRAEEVVTYLRDREGPSFDFLEVAIRLPSERPSSGCPSPGDAFSERIVQAQVAVNDPTADSYIGNRSTEETASMIGGAEGEHGTCIEYLRETREKLRALSIEDKAVERLWESVRRSA